MKIKKLKWVDGYRPTQDYIGLATGERKSLFCHINKYDTGWHCYIEVPDEGVDERFDTLEEAQAHCQKGLEVFIQSCFDTKGEIRKLVFHDNQCFIDGTDNHLSWCDVTVENDEYDFDVAFFDYIKDTNERFDTVEDAFVYCQKMFEEFVNSCLEEDYQLVYARKMAKAWNDAVFKMESGIPLGKGEANFYPLEEDDD